MKTVLITNSLTPQGLLVVDQFGHQDWKIISIERSLNGSRKFKHLAQSNFIEKQNGSEKIRLLSSDIMFDFVLINEELSLSFKRYDKLMKQLNEYLLLVASTARTLLQHKKLSHGASIVILLPEVKWPEKFKAIAESFNFILENLVRKMNDDQDQVGVQIIIIVKSEL